MDGGEASSATTTRQQRPLKHAAITTQTRWTYRRVHTANSFGSAREFFFGFGSETTLVSQPTFRAHVGAKLTHDFGSALIAVVTSSSTDARGPVRMRACSIAVAASRFE